MAKRWRIATHDPARVDALERAAGVPTVVAQLLICRGIEDAEIAREFLAPKLTGLRDPELLPGASQAAELLHRAVAEGRRIVVYGDYDADGMTAAAILLRCLRMLGADADFYVPHRIDEGYGLHRGALEELASQGAHTVITVDCGIASVAQADAARELGLELIITDHHQFADRLPDAAVLVHPQLPGWDYPFAGLCGAGVALKVAWALCQKASGARRVGERMKRFLLQAVGLAAIGAVADVVPLVDENRILVHHGLNALRNCPTAGVAALLDICQLQGKKQLSSEDIAFSMAPRLNAAGRLGQAELGVELLSTEDPKRAADLAKYLSELNETRQSLERSVLRAARKQVRELYGDGDAPGLVLADREWHPGVIGIVAGKLAETYHRPVVLISLDKLGVKAGIGSGRSTPGFNLHQAFAHCTERLVSHGGHAAAAGLKIEEGSIDRFRDEFCACVEEQLGAVREAAELAIDAETPLAGLTKQSVGQMERLAPFGCGNQRPTLCTSAVRLAAAPKRMGAAGRHLSVEIEQHGVRIRGVAFGAGDWEDDLAKVDGPIDVAFRPVINSFRGWDRVEVHLEDWKPTEK